jgi:D-alanine-D-alanine ligase
MDKTVAKIMFKELGIPQADWVTVLSHELDENVDAVISRIEEKLPYPVFVKPANAGSSVGIGKAKNREQLTEALFTAADHDYKILVEEYIKGREIESAAYGNREIFIAEPGEIVSAKEFYDFEAKYQIASTIDIPACLKPETIDKVKCYAKKLFSGIGLSGLSRIDFFVTENDEVYINEINTIPGFTSISMYPKMCIAGGLSYSNLINRLLDLAIERFKTRLALKNSR